jgi:superoxide reductase
VYLGDFRKICNFFIRSETFSGNERSRTVKARREFLKTAVAIAGLTAFGKTLEAATSAKFPPGLVYTKDYLGRWAGKEALHLPRVTVTGKELKIVTAHPMTKEHFIVKHTLLTPEGKVLGEKTFDYTDPAAESSYQLLPDLKGILWATSFCNLHDLWLTEVQV